MDWPRCPGPGRARRGRRRSAPRFNQLLSGGACRPGGGRRSAVGAPRGKDALPASPPQGAAGRAGGFSVKDSKLRSWSPVTGWGGPEPRLLSELCPRAGGWQTGIESRGGRTGEPGVSLVTLKDCCLVSLKIY